MPVTTLEDLLMLEIANSVVSGDLVDIAIGGDTSISPSDFDEGSEEGQVMSLIDIIIDKA